MERLTLPVELVDPATGKVAVLFAMGAAEGATFPTLYMSGGDIVNLRNGQLGFAGATPGGDISAGGAGGPNDPRMPLALQYDNGNHTTVYDGRKREIMSLRGYDDQTKNVARFMAPVRFWHGALVRRSDGSWHRL